jgi:hypothetical protein
MTLKQTIRSEIRRQITESQFGDQLTEFNTNVGEAVDVIEKEIAMLRKYLNTQKRLNPATDKKIYSILNNLNRLHDSYFAFVDELDYYNLD